MQQADTGWDKTRLELATQAGDIGVWSWDAATGEVVWSERLERIYGLEPGSFGGRMEDYLALLHPEDREAARSGAEETLRNGGRHLTVHRVVWPDGQIRWVEGRAAVLTSESGEPSGMVGVTIDVTARELAAERARRERRLLLNLQRAANVLLGGGRLRRTMRLVVDEIRELLGADMAVAVYPAPKLGEEVMHSAVSAARRSRARFNAEGAAELIGQHLVADIVVRIDDLQSAPEGSADWLAGVLPGGIANMRSGMVVALRALNGSTVGALIVAARSPNAFSIEDERLLHGIGLQTSAALASASRYEAQREAVGLMQRQLLPPRSFSVEGLDICVRYHPGQNSVAIGGDWYDVVPEADDRVILVVGDVCGHGVAAAAQMAQLRFAFRALLRAGVAIEECIQALNRIAIEELHTTCTLVVVNLQLRSGAYEYWSMGHPPGLVARGTDSRWLDGQEGRAPMLGFVDDYEPARDQGVLDRGEVLLLFTDGLIERRRESLDVGMERLATSLPESGRGIDDWCDEVYDALVDQENAFDDTVLLAVRRV